MSHRIRTVEALERLYRKPTRPALDKETPQVNDSYRRLIEAAPFVVVASIGPEGMDCSPRGDRPGFVRILDPESLAIPDRRGNNRLDTLRNIVADPRVALLFFIPGWNETLRVNGHAHLTTDPELLRGFEVEGSVPVSAIVVSIRTMYFQCARALKRSRLWDPEARTDPATLPSAGELITSVAEDFDGAAYDATLEERQRRTLY